jgi:hypothetical protein
MGGVSPRCWNTVCDPVIRGRMRRIYGDMGLGTIITSTVFLTIIVVLVTVVSFSANGTSKPDQTACKRSLSDLLAIIDRASTQARALAAAASDRLRIRIGRSQPIQC